MLYATICKRVLDIIRIKVRHLKGENKANGKVLRDSILNEQIRATFHKYRPSSGTSGKIDFAHILLTAIDRP